MDNTQHMQESQNIPQMWVTRLQWLVKHSVFSPLQLSWNETLREGTRKQVHMVPRQLIGTIEGMEIHCLLLSRNHQVKEPYTSKGTWNSSQKWGHCGKCLVKAKTSLNPRKFFFFFPPIYLLLNVAMLLETSGVNTKVKGDTSSAVQ